MQTIERSWVEDRLKRISAALIEAHRNGNTGLIRRYAIQGGINLSGTEQPKRLFMRTIQVFHPDRCGLFMQKVAAFVVSKDQPGLEALQAMLAYQSENGVFTRGPSRAQERSSNQDFSYEEEYGFDEEDFGYGEDDADERDRGWSDDEFVDDTEEPDEFREGTFMEALKRELFGNLELYPSPQELETMEGELDLSDYEINDLSGAELCRSISSLNLAMNNIDNIFPLGGLVNLEFLDLSSNGLEDADELSGLANLKELDISFNEIEDLAFLEKMHRLTCVSVIGNPIKDRSVLDKLQKRGVLVIE